jgi:hypothetical protein
VSQPPTAGTPAPMTGPNRKHRAPGRPNLAARRLLGTAQLTAGQWGLALLAAVVLLLGWEAGKWIARRTTLAKRATVPAR